MTNLDSLLRSRDITLPTKVHLFKAMVFPVVMYGCESWTIKKVECWRIDAFELWCWRLLSVPWTARRSNQSILKEISPECSLEGLILKLKLPKLWPLDAKNLLIWKDSDDGKDWRWEKKWMTEDEMVGWHHWLISLSKLQELDGQRGLVCWSPWGRKDCKTQLSDWTELNWNLPFNRKICNHFLKSKCISKLSWNFFKNTNAQELLFFLQSSRYVSNEQTCLKTTGLYEDLLPLPS